MSAISEKYAQLGGQYGILGAATSAETSCPDGKGRYRHYKTGSIYWHPNTGAWYVKSAIRNHYASLGWERSFLGYPISDEIKSTDNMGFYSYFEKGAIYWHPDTGAHEVHGDIRKRYVQMGAEKSILKYPTTDETKTPDGIGRYNHFQSGSIYYHPNNGAWDIRGAIREKYAQLGWEKSFLGYPKTGENTLSDNIGKYNRFDNGYIFWSPSTHAHEVHGSIMSLYSRNTMEKRLGYPLTDELLMNNHDSGRYNKFQHGYITWTPSMDAYFDYCGNNEGHYSGKVSLYKDINFRGTEAHFELSNQKPILFNAEIRDKGIHDNISSLKLSNFSQYQSLYLYEHSDFSGKYVKISGDSNNNTISIANIGNHLNDKISSAMIVNHGTASILFTEKDLQPLLDKELSKYKVPKMKWHKASKVSMVPGENSIKFTLYGLVEDTWPDSEIRIEIYFRPLITGSESITIHFTRWYAHSSGSFAGYANSTILSEIRKFFKENSHNIEKQFNDVLAEKMKAFEAVPNAVKKILNTRRIHIIPEGVELVISDNKLVPTILQQQQSIANINIIRSSGMKKEGKV